MRILIVILLSLIGTCCSQSATELVQVTDSNIYFSSLNWYIDSLASPSYAMSNNPGAYIKAIFDGTYFAFQFDLTGSPVNPYMTLRYTIDDAPFVDIVLPDSITLYTFEKPISASAPSSPPSYRVGEFKHPQVLSSGNHTLHLWILNSNEQVDRWTPLNFVKITAFIVEKGSSFYAPPLKSKQMLVYWDSIGEGINVHGNVGTFREKNSCLEVWHQTLGLALDAEVSVVAFGRLGWAIDGNGKVPQFINPSNPSYQSWDRFFGEISRLDNTTSQYIHQPDFIFIGHGTNDALNNIDKTSVQENVIAFLIAVRKAAPKATVFMIIPFGLFYGEVISDAFDEYQQQMQDSNAFLLNLGDEAAQGIHSVGRVSEYASDGIHPFGFRSLQLGGILAEAAMRVLETANIKSNWNGPQYIYSPSVEDSSDLTGYWAVAASVSACLLAFGLFYKMRDQRRSYHHLDSRVNES